MRRMSKKLKGGFGGGDGKGRRRLQEPAAAQLDELARSSQDMQDMRDCYDSLLSAAAATANSAYEFSVSLKEMGSCLLEKTALNDDEESGKVLLMIGKVQFELQKLVDKYRAHIFRTITSPSESLLNELRIVEEMKRLCDEKRSVYEDMKTAHREKGRLKSKKGESISSQELQTAYNEFDEEATLFVFRLKSLKQGQSRCLLTQAARHHSAQLSFFRKALKSLDTVEPHVKSVTQQQHIDYQFSELDDDGETEDDSHDDDGDDDDDGSISEDIDGESSSDYAPNTNRQNFVSMELDKAEVASRIAKDESKENLYKLGRNSVAFSREMKASSQSAPLSAEKKFDPVERVRQMRQLSSRKSYSYVLPTPVEPKKSLSEKPDPHVFRARHPNLSAGAINYRHSSPLVQINYENILEKGKVSSPMRLSQPPPLGEYKTNNISSTGLPPPLAEELSSQFGDQYSTIDDAKKVKRQAFSGPLTDKSWPNKRGLSTTRPLDSAERPKLFSGPLLHSQVQKSMSSPKISELHELPRPPPLVKLSGSYSNQIGYSGPLISKRQEINATNRLVVPKIASPLPRPPTNMARSFSIPSRGQKVALSPISTPLGSPQTKSVENMASPPLTPISLSSVQ